MNLYILIKKLQHTCINSLVAIIVCLLKKYTPILLTFGK